MAAMAGKSGWVAFPYYHFSKGQCSVAIASLLASPDAWLLTLQPHLAHAACWALYWRQVWQMASSASISSWLRVGRPAAIHLDTALVYRPARLMMPGRGGGDCLAWALAEPVAPSDRKAHV